MPRYRVKRAGALVDGTFRKEGAIVTLSAEQAKYYLPPHDDRLEEVKPVEPKPEAKAPAKIPVDKG